MTLNEALNKYLILCEELKLNAIEFRFQKEDFRPSSWPWELNEEIINFLNRFKCVGVHLPFLYLNLICPNIYIKKESLNQIKLGIKKASDLGMDYCVMHASGYINGFTHDEMMVQWLDVMNEITEYAEKNEILLTIENSDFFINLHDLVNIVEVIDSHNLKITFDVGHAHIRNVPPLSSYPIRGLALRFLDTFFPLYFINENMPYERFKSIDNFLKLKYKLIANVHLHDFNGIRDHMIIGDGYINFSFLKYLRHVFTGPYIIESTFNSPDELKIAYGNFLRLIK